MSETEDYSRVSALAAHKTTHENAGSDEISVAGLSGLLADDQHVLDAEVKLIKLDDFAVPDDNTDLNASTAKHGLLKKLSNVVTQFLNGQGSWSTPAVSGRPVENAIINGGMSVAQRATSFVAGANGDDVYTLDRWVLLSDGADIVDVTQQSGGGVSGNEDYIRLDVETAQKKFGILQIIENKNCKNLIGQTVSLSFEAKVTDATKLSDIRAVVIAWDGAADSVTSDIISAWSIEGTRPTLVANWTGENTDSDLGVTTSWVRYTIEGISIDTASAANIAVFIYQNNLATNDTAGIFLEITNVQLENGSVATDFEYRQFQDELAKCQRYAFVPATPGASSTVGTGLCNTPSLARIEIGLPVTMRTTPSIIITATDWKINDYLSEQDVTSIVLWTNTYDCLTMDVTCGGAGLTANNHATLVCDGTANRKFIVNAEL